MDPRLAKVLAGTFRMPLASVDETTSQASVPEWDSLGHLNLVAALEEAFHISLTMDEILNMRDVPAIARILAAKGVLAP